MLAAIDVGTNTARMLIGEVCGGQVLPQSYHRVITRLGGGFTQEKGLAPDAMERTLFALGQFASEARRASVESIRVVGTEALRKACNGQQFAHQVQTETGLCLEIIDGQDEALFSARGVLSALNPSPEFCLIFDIGGGSTEFIFWSRNQGVQFQKSYPLGVVVLCEQFPDEVNQVARIDELVAQAYFDLTAKMGEAQVAQEGFELVGTAGTVTTLAAMKLQLQQYDWRLVNNSSLDNTELLALEKLLLPLSVSQRETLPGLEEGRGDLILPGIRVVKSILSSFGRTSMTVSDFGLLEGVLIKQSSVVSN